MPLSFWKSSVSVLKEKRSGLFPFDTSFTSGLYSETAFFRACDRILFIISTIICYCDENNYMLCAFIVNILYKQLINRTFIERDKIYFNKKIQKRVSN